MPLAVQEICDLAVIWTPRLALFARLWTDSEDDAVQEAFLNLYRLKIRPDDPVAWLFKATRNAAVSISRSEASHARRRKAAAMEQRNWFDQSVENQLDAVAVTEKLQELPPELREVVVTRIWGELTFEQIAASMKISAATAYRRYNEAIAELRKRLKIKEE